MLIIHASIRQKCGKSSSRRLRISNRFPAIVYGGNEPLFAIEIAEKFVINLQLETSFYKNVISLVVDGIETKVRVQAMQRHPFKPKIHHIDFMRIVESSNLSRYES
ncbi:50S ribosomal protein L25 [Candidatus Erwinia haradaeae]|uniref:Large ribosomal subunit protein bL25 n=1 Tax=Candidatus Erwinia haradaeae TaxID=1922217 RepID=A0A451CZH7_9GAMM|nr:50S ribosomal protein L25 [Candidatus Erwinia haradaeae]VFP78807.1 50S ribosomal protein L25 [Candidatus Erwinia haradaeae]